MPNRQEFNVTLRKAGRDDMVQVYELIKELAEFEKFENQLIIDEAVLQHDGFDSESPAFACIVAELSNGNIIGYALYYFSFSSFLGRVLFLEDLYIQPAYRRSGIGKQIFQSLAKICADEKIGTIEFNVLSWNPAVHFYKRLGAVNLTETEKRAVFRMNQDALNLLSKS